MATAHTLVSPYHPHPQSSPSNVQSMTGDFRLPSIKDLNFPTQLPSQEATPVPNGSDHGSLQSAHSARHQHSAWSRNAQASSNGSSQHNSSMPPPPDPVKSSHKVTLKSEGGYAPQGMHYSPETAQSANGAVTGHVRASSASQASSKRGRSSSTVSASTGRSPHSSNISHTHQAQHSSPTYPPVPPPQSQGSPPQAHQASPPYPQAGQGYPYPPPQMAQRAYPVQPSQAPPTQHQQHQHQAPPSNTYPPPPAPHEHWQHTQAPPPGQQPPYDNFLRTTPIVPATVEPRSTPQQPTPESDRGSKDNIINEIVHHCNALWSFASRYAQNPPQYQPPPEELRKMTQFASTVVRLLEELKRMSTPEGHISQSSFSEDARPPKRPWEDSSPEEEAVDQSEDNLQSTAEQDMEIIRSKRATSSGANTPGQPKSKYRKRSRATPPGKCHSCNIRETPEWRRGPDGARTLCNACGLHYAKLMRKRDKALGADGKPVTIDLQTLRASTASSRGGGESSGELHPVQGGTPAQAPPPAQHHNNTAPVSGQYEPQQQQQQAHAPPPPPPHGSPYQLIPVSAQNQQPPSAAHQMMPPPPPQNHEHSMPNTIPPPPWSTTGRYPTEQSYIRQPPPHSRSPQ